MYALHNTSGGSDADCVSHFSEADKWKCLFAAVRHGKHCTNICYKFHVFFLQYTFPFIKTETFVLNSLYDTAQLAGILGLDCLPPNCSDQQMKFFDNFRNVRTQILIDNVLVSANFFKSSNS